MRNLIDHIRKNLFIWAAGMAALVHSMWTLDVLFAGKEITFANDPVNALFRKAIAFGIALSIDIGQVQTSGEIRDGQRSKTKYLTFFTFAAATYFLQWVYMAHHVPTLELGAGVRAEWDGAVRLLLDLSIWIVPALLPLSTLLYTFSQSADKTIVKLGNGTTVLVEKDRAHSTVAPATTIPANTNASTTKRERVERIDTSSGGSGSGNVGDGNGMLAANIVETAEQHHELALTVHSSMQPTKTAFAMGDTWTAVCPHCGWRKDGYAKESSALQGIRSHKPYCQNPGEWVTNPPQTTVSRGVEAGVEVEQGR